MEPQIEQTHDKGVELIAPLTRPVDTLDELQDKYLGTVAASIWRTCCWPERMSDGWQIGDYRFVVLAVSPDPNASLYVQFWSEPAEVVLMEVSSGEWSPGSVKYLQEPQRQMLASFGLQKGGNAKNFGKELPITDVREAEAAARDTLRIFFDVFGFRGQWPLEIQTVAEGRSEDLPVLTSLTPQDYAKLVVEAGCIATVVQSESGPLVLCERGRRRFVARMAGRVPKQNLYSAVTLMATIAPKGTLTAEQLVALNSEFLGISVQPDSDGDIQLAMLVQCGGGVTMNWIVHAVGYWMNTLRQCERRVRRLRSDARPAHRSGTSLH